MKHDVKLYSNRKIKRFIMTKNYRFGKIYERNATWKSLSITADIKIFLSNKR